MSNKIYTLNNEQREGLVEFISKPNGSFETAGIVFEAVEGGGLMIRPSLSQKDPMPWVCSHGDRGPDSRVFLDGNCSVKYAPRTDPKEWT